MEMSPAGLCLQNFRNFVGVGVGCVTLEAAENGEDGVAYSDFSHTVQARVLLICLLGVFSFERLIGFCSIVNR